MKEQVVMSPQAQSAMSTQDQYPFQSLPLLSGVDRCCIYLPLQLWQDIFKFLCTCMTSIRENDIYAHNGNRKPVTYPSGDSTGSEFLMADIHNGKKCEWYSNILVSEYSLQSVLVPYFKASFFSEEVWRMGLVTSVERDKRRN